MRWSWPRSSSPGGGGDATGEPTGTGTTAGPGSAGGSGAPSSGDPSSGESTGTSSGAPTTGTGSTGPDPADLVEPGDPGPGDITLTIRADQDPRPISPWIYGTNQVLDLSSVRLVRQGGNRMTADNWENNASNAGADYLHQNDGFLESTLGVDGSIPGEVRRTSRRRPCTPASTRRTRGGR